MLIRIKLGRMVQNVVQKCSKGFFKTTDENVIFVSVPATASNAPMMMRTMAFETAMVAGGREREGGEKEDEPERNKNKLIHNNNEE